MAITVNYVIQGGGGAGGNGGAAFVGAAGSGGGAGGRVTGSTSITGAVAVTVGDVSSFGSGNASSIAGVGTALGGGRGGNWNGAGSPGGCGGGGLTSGAGSQGGNGGINDWAGGGGVTANGVNGGTFGVGVGGNGGAGYTSPISGTLLGAGGGGGDGTGGRGWGGFLDGVWGMGAVVSPGAIATVGKPNTGSGGGGGTQESGGFVHGGNQGAAGVVEIDYAGTTVLATGGTISTSGGRTRHIFQTSGTFTPIAAPTITAVDNTSTAAVNDAVVKRGTTAYTHIFGTGLTPTTTGTVSGTGVTAPFAAFGGDTLIALNITATAAAPVGPRTLTVTNEYGTSNAVTLTVVGGQHQMFQVF